MQIIFPGDDFSQDCDLGRSLTASDVSDIKRGDKFRLYIMALAKYVDAFGKDRHTQICASVGGPFFARAVDTAVAAATAGECVTVRLPFEYTPNTTR
jgi:hypothetical protein